MPTRKQKKKNKKKNLSTDTSKQDIYDIDVIDEDEELTNNRISNGNDVNREESAPSMEEADDVPVHVESRSSKSGREESAPSVEEADDVPVHVESKSSKASRGQRSGREESAPSVEEADDVPAHGGGGLTESGVQQSAMGDESMPSEDTKDGGLSNGYTGTDDGGGAIEEKYSDIVGNKSTRSSSDTVDGTKETAVDNRVFVDWIGDMVGRPVLKAAEVVICEMMLLHSRSEGGLWRWVMSQIDRFDEISSSHSEDKSDASKAVMVDINTVLDIWEMETGVPLSSSAICALHVRCGSLMVSALREVSALSHPPPPGEMTPAALPSERPALLKKILGRFCAKKIQEHLTSSGQDAVLDKRLLWGLVEEQESLLSLWLVQMSRISPYIADLGADASLPIDQELLKGLAMRLGMPALSKELLLAFSNWALRGVGTEIRFNSDGTERPPLVQLQLACAARCKEGEVKTVQEQMNMLVCPYSGHNADGIPSRSLLSLFSSDSTGAMADVPLHILCKHLRQEKSDLTDRFIGTCIMMWTGLQWDVEDGEGELKKGINLLRCGMASTNASDSSLLVQRNTVMQFLFPFGVSIRGVSVLGKGYYSRKLQPIDSTEKLHSFLANKFFMKFRKTYCSGEDGRKRKIPSDVRIYASDSAGGRGEEILPSKKTIVADVCGEDDIIFIESAYVSDFHGKHLSTMEPETEHPPSTGVKKIADTLTKPSVVTIKPAKRFDREYDTAHMWSVPIVCRYLREVVELSQYEENFLRYEINGYAFLCLDEPSVVKCCGTKNTIHAAKIALHAGNLRTCVLRTALDFLPSSLEEWHPVHVAAVVDSDFHAPEAAIQILRHQMGGEKIVSLGLENIPGAVQKFKCRSSEIKRCTDGLLELLSTYHKMIKVKSKEQITEHVVPPGKKSSNAKKETAMARRKKKIENEMKQRRIEAKDTPPYGIIEAKAGQSMESKDVMQPTVRGTDEESIEHNSSECTEENGGDEGESHVSSEASTALTSPMLARDTSDNFVDEKDPENECFGHCLATPESVLAANTEGVKKSFENTIHKQPIEKTQQPSETREMDRQSRPRGKKVNKSRPTARNESTTTNSEQHDLILEQIKALQNVVETHSSVVNTLRKENEKLRKEKRRAELKARHQQENKTNENNIRELIEQRDTAVRTLATVAQHYVENVNGDSAIVDDTVEGSPNGESVIVSQPDYAVPVPMRNNHEEPSVTRTSGLHDSLSEKSVTGRNTRRNIAEEINVPHADHSAPETRRNDHEKLSISHTYKTQHSPVANSVSEGTMRRTEGNEAVSQLDYAVPESKHRDVAQFISGTSSRTSNMHRSPMLKLVDSTKDQSITELILDDCTAECSLWQKILEVYRYEKEPLDIGKFEDSGAVFRRIAIAWMRLGKIMFDDATGLSADLSSAVEPEVMAGVLRTIHSSVDKIRGNASRTVHSSLPVFALYAGLVFTLVLAHKILRKFSSRNDHVNLTQLLRSLRSGDAFPMSEVSREDLKLFLEECFLMDCEKWHLVNSICLKFEADRNGYLSLSRVISSFENLNCLHIPLKSHRDGQLGVVFVVCVATAQILSFKMRFSDIVKKIIVDYRKVCPSFSAYLVDSQNEEYFKSCTCDAKYASESAIIADFLYVMLCNYFGYDADSFSGIGLGTSTFSKKPVAKNNYFDEEISVNKTTVSTPLTSNPPYVSFIVSNIRPVCSAVARAFFLYDYTSERRRQCVFDSLLTLIVTFVDFWSKSLLDCTDSSREMSRKFNRILSDLDERLCTLIGTENASSIRERSHDLNAEGMENLVSELIGIPLPEGHCGGSLLSSVVEVSSLFPSRGLIQTTMSDRGATIGSGNHAQWLSGDQSFPQPQRLDTRSSQRMARTSSVAPTAPSSPSKNARPHPGALVDRTSQLLHSHRLEQVSLYLHALNEKSRIRKTILKALLALMRECKSYVRRRDKGGDGESLRGRTFMNFHSRREEILADVRVQQRVLLDDMQRQSGTQMELVVNHVKKLSAALKASEVSDPDGSLSKAIHETEEMENSILQSNDDALLLIDSIKRLMQ